MVIDDVAPLLVATAGGGIDTEAAGAGVATIAGVAGTAAVSGFTRLAGACAGDLPSPLVVLVAIGFAAGAGLSDALAGDCLVLSCIVLDASGAALVAGFVAFDAAGVGVAAGAGLGLGFTPRRSLIGGAFAGRFAAFAGKFNFSVGCGGSSTLALASAKRSLK